ncbi:hypothetical protein AB9N12_04965 [Bacteroides sp. AN502(2024)]|uniref:hypothetical protein n=1 Tax=Bacteroides sp. AN502(2024) TaxID=3160599 RepID=UPI0035170F0A
MAFKRTIKQAFLAATAVKRMIKQTFLAAMAFKRTIKQTFLDSTAFKRTIKQALPINIDKIRRVLYLKDKESAFPLFERNPYLCTPNLAY